MIFISIMFMMGLHQDLNYSDDIYIHNFQNGMLPGVYNYVYYDLVPPRKNLVIFAGCYRSVSPQLPHGGCLLSSESNRVKCGEVNDHVVFNKSAIWDSLLPILMPAYNLKFAIKSRIHSQNFNGANVEVWQWIINFILYFTEYLVTYPCWDWS